MRIPFSGFARIHPLEDCRSSGSEPVNCRKRQFWQSS
ncbi:hypothetical protein TMatcc_001522 [Talaromyces marneffei ATCC 18224]